MLSNQKVLTEPSKEVGGEACLHHADGGVDYTTEGKPEILLKIPSNLMEEILDRENLRTAHLAVTVNKGCSGIDGMSTEELYSSFRGRWPELKRQLLEGDYRPQPVKRVEIPKADGGVRMLGIPTVQDRFIQQAVHQVLQRYIDPTFSEHSYGFRPKRSALQAIDESKRYVESGHKVVVDIDLEKFFDRVNHDKLMSELYKRIKDTRVLKLIRSYLDAGAVCCNGLFIKTEEGTPQGGPLSPLLSNVMLDLLDKELEKRGHKFVRYADDCNIYVRTSKAGERVMKSISDFITKKLKLKVNEKKSAVGSPRTRKFLGFVILHGKDGTKIGISLQSQARLKDKIRKLTKMTKGVSIEILLAGLKKYLNGWRAYYGHARTPSVFKSLDSWIRHRLRCYILQQWGKGSGTHRALKNLGRPSTESNAVAWSSKGPWRLSQGKYVQVALTNRVLEGLGYSPLAQ